MTKTMRGVAPAHPGAVLKEIVLPALKEQGTSRTKVAELLGVGRQTLYDLLDGKSSVTPDMALRLSRLLGNSPEHWMNMQTAYDLHHAQEKLAAVLEAIPRLKGVPGQKAA